MSPEAQLEGFIAKYSPEIGDRAEAVLAKMRALLPGAYELVYDNYNALAIGFSPTERTPDAVFSIALYPRWINLFFLDGATLPDAEKRLQGSGKQVRSVRLSGPETLDEPAVQALMAHALDAAGWTPAAETGGRLIIKSVSEKQRPRRP